MLNLLRRGVIQPAPKCLFVEMWGVDLPPAANLTANAEITLPRGFGDPGATYSPTGLLQFLARLNKLKNFTKANGWLHVYYGASKKDGGKQLFALRGEPIGSGWRREYREAEGDASSSDEEGDAAGGGAGERRAAEAAATPTADGLGRRRRRRRRRGGRRCRRRAAAAAERAAAAREGGGRGGSRRAEAYARRRPGRVRRPRPSGRAAVAVAAAAPATILPIAPPAPIASSCRATASVSS